MVACNARLASGTAISLLMTFGLMAGAAVAQTAPTTEDDETIVLEKIVISAEDQVKQALGASTITSEDIARQPVVNDIAQIIRKQPGVNLTGTTASGAFGNNRQIDIRGMGPENTLILIDGRPVLSRNATKMGRSGERDSKGDSNWVPAELIERIDVIRGPAAARYGSGAAGGVVNIITKRPDTAMGNVNLSYHLPGDSAEGSSRRANILLATPLSETLSFRLTANLNRTEGDDQGINYLEDAAEGDTAQPAGRSGSRNRDFGALLTWAPVDGHEIDLDFAYSRQATIYSGECENSNCRDNEVADSLIGSEVPVIRRGNLALTHRGEYAFGESFSYLQWENTRNTRNGTQNGGRNTGKPSNEKYTNTLDNVTAKTEWVLPFQIGALNQTTTLGAEFRGEKLDDPSSFNRDEIPGAPSSGLEDQQTYSLYAESNIAWDDRLTLTPALRVDHNSNFGTSWSPSLNAEYDITDEWTMKVGVARATKTPNLYQLNPTYYWNTNGNGCPFDPATGAQFDGPCYVRGNPDLQQEHSINKEIGFAYNGFNGISGSLTLFQNDYKNRITQSRFPVEGIVLDDGTLLEWVNTPEAVVRGLEGNFATDIGETFAFNANATYMLESRDKDTNQPLSLVPEYTINASLDWYARDDLTFTLSATHYGKVEAPTFNPNNGTTYANPKDREAYTLFGLNGSWDINDRVTLSGGIDNLLDKQLYRESGSGNANSYNEPGRSFYIGLNTSF